MAVPTETAGATGSIPYLSAGALAEFTKSGTYYCETTITDLPEGQSAGVVVIATAETAGNQHDLTFYHFKGLEEYSDKLLNEYEAFIFPQESAQGLDAFSGWRKIQRDFY